MRNAYCLRGRFSSESFNSYALTSVTSSLRNCPLTDMTDINLNFRPNYSELQVKTPTFNRLRWNRTYMQCRSKRDRMTAIKRYKEFGVEETIPGICSRCEDPSKDLYRKHPTNIHYNCLEKCCRLLHQWDMCKSCVDNTHLVKNQRSSHSEVVTFQSVFSRLPDDVKRYITEFVPAIATYIVSANQLFRHGNRYDRLDEFANRPKAFWTNISKTLYESHIYITPQENTRKKICDYVKREYKNTYLKYTRGIVNDSDFWYHKEYEWDQPKGRELYSINGLAKVNNIIQQ